MNKNSFLVESLGMIIGDLSKCSGIASVFILADEDRGAISIREEKHNIGVLECLKKDVVLVIIHDSFFRKPIHSMIVENENGIYFPPLPFDELSYLGAISSSPSLEIHKFLSSKYNLKLDLKSATLFVGFNFEDVKSFVK